MVVKYGTVQLISFITHWILPNDFSEAMAAPTALNIAWW